MSDRGAFDLTGALPSGVSALEASAGTGKTFALTALAVRYLAEIPLHPSQLCLVSFTEAATAELRGRVRTRLVEALRHCVNLLAGRYSEISNDPVLAAIANLTTDPQITRSRAENLRVAVAEFDAATIATIHGFCQRILISAGEAEDTRRITEGSEEIAEVVNDLLIAAVADPEAFGVPDASLLVKGNLASRIAAAVAKSLSMPDAQWSYGDLPTDKKPHAANLRDEAITRVIVGLVNQAVVEVSERRRRRAQTTFDGVITSTRDLLRGDRSTTLIAALRDRYKVVLIDEFQDTDSVQWDIFRSAFIDSPELGPRPAVTIVGDPKQSIYRFRSAELSAYLSAVEAAGEQVSTLDTNWRSDGDLLDALDNVMDGFTFGDERVEFHSVLTAPDLSGSRLIGTQLAPLEIRCVRDLSGTAPATWLARAAIRNDIVGVVAAHLKSEMVIRSRTSDDLGEYSTRRVQPSDIAILTRSNADASKVALALSAAGIPAATASSQSVLESEAAFQWRVLLEAIQRPGSVGLVKAAALGWFLGYSAVEIDAFDDEAIARLQDRLREWSVLLLQRGVSGLVHRARHEGLQARLLAGSSGERDLTDLDHVAEVLHNLSGGRPASAPMLLALLAEAESEGEDDTLASDFLARRIDRDDQAVSVLTVHKSKGLEYPILLLPFMWTKSGGSHGVPHAVRSGVRELDGTWIPDLNKTKLNASLRDRNAEESQGEARRLLYVALTRARHRCVVWFPEGSGASALAELFEHRIGAPVESISDLQPLVAASTGRISVVQVPTSTRMPEPLDPAAAPGVQREEVLEEMMAMRVLCAHRQGPFGVQTWNRVAGAWSQRQAESADKVGGGDLWYPGKVVMVTANDERLGLFNGDLGVVINHEGQMRVAIENASGVRLIPPGQFESLETASAMTIHKSQGSEFDHVVVVLPSADSRLATRELLYTGVTRAKAHMTLVASEAVIAAAITTRITRASGLQAQLW
jgi:exodeoxyribonuclease V beta subunit